MKIKIFIATLFFLASFVLEAKADAVYLKNGRSMKGLIKKETQEGVWLDIGIGAVKFKWEEIDKIDKSGIEEAGRIRQEWQKEKALVEKEAGSKEKENGPKEVEFSEIGGNIVVNVLLNNKVNATLYLDTGAHSVLLSDRIAEGLGIKTQGLKTKTTAVAGISDLRIVDTILDSIKIGNVEARNVDVELSLDKFPASIKDGLLGMSFLKKFKFQIDNVSKKLILEEKKSQNILKKTKYFSVVIPSDWETWIDEENIVIEGPNLTVKKGSENPHIVVKKNIDEQTLSYSKAVKKAYDYFKNLPDIKHKMSEGLKENFEKSYSQSKYEPVSFDFEEKKDFIMLHSIFISKENSTSVKRHEVNIITKSEPVRGYNLSFACVEQYFDKFLLVFKACLESFVINE